MIWGWPGGGRPKRSARPAPFGSPTRWPRRWSSPPLSPPSRPRAAPRCWRPRRSWQAAGAVPAAEQTVVLLGRVPGADGAQRSAAQVAADRLVALGVETVDGRQLSETSAGSGAVEVRVLGRFEVVVGGREVPLPAWRSRQARTLLKILVARRGRAIGRAELCELLWPDDEPRRTARRLSVLLSAVRAVLDPHRRWPVDRYVRADLTGVRVDLTPGGRRRGAPPRRRATGRAPRPRR